jgi:GT2 family glycosyltransferase
VSGPSVAACIVNWNTREDTIECLQALLDSGERPDVIVVVDNHSTDDSVIRIESWAMEAFEGRSVTVCSGEQYAFEQGRRQVEFVLVRNHCNNGFAAGANKAVEVVQLCGQFDYLWFLNSDTIVAPGAMAALLDCARENPDQGVIGSTVVFADRPEIVQCAGGCIYNKWTTRYHAILQGHPLSAVWSAPDGIEISYVYGASMFVRSAVFESGAKFNDDFFLYFEELDFCNRVVSAGFRLGWCKASLVAHKNGASLKNAARDERGRRVFSNYHENLSTLIYTKTHHPYGLYIVFPARLFGKLAALAVRRDWYLMPVLWRAYVDFVLGVNRRDVASGVVCASRSKSS